MAAQLSHAKHIPAERTGAGAVRGDAIGLGILPFPAAAVARGRGASHHGGMRVTIRGRLREPRPRQGAVVRRAVRCGC
jgi:hypothetical protein